MKRAQKKRKNRKLRVRQVSPFRLNCTLSVCGAILVSGTASAGSVPSAPALRADQVAVAPAEAPPAPTAPPPAPAEPPPSDAPPSDAPPSDAPPSDTPPNPAVPPPNPDPVMPPVSDPTAPVTPLPQPGVTPAQPPTVPPTVPPTSPAMPLPAPAPTPAPDGAAPAPGAAVPTPDSSEVDVKADWGIYIEERNFVRGRGNVVLTYRDVVLTADELEADLNTRDVLLKGNAVVQSGGRTVRGDQLGFNLRTRAWRITRGEAAVLPPRLLSPLYVRSESAFGTRRLIEGDHGSLTTCDLEEPHYHFAGRHITIIPERRAVIRRASLYVKGHRWFTIPRLVIPLSRHRYNIVPEVGQNNIEGAYVKTAYYYPTRDGGVGTARFDVMTKRGVGVGVDHGYQLGRNGAGQIVLYSILGGALLGKEWTGSVRHGQKIGAWDGRLQSDFRNNSYQFTPGTRSVSHDVGLSRRTTRASTDLGFRTSENSGAFGEYSQRNVSLAQTRTWGLTAMRLNMNLFDSQSAQITQRELATQLNLDRRQPAYDLGLAYHRRDLLEAPENGFFSSLDRLPELTFGTHRRRIRGGIFRFLPGSFGLSVGEFHEEPGGVESARVLLDLGVDPHTSRLGRSELTVGGNFTQMMYRSDAAQYVVNANANWRIPLFGTRLRGTAFGSAYPSSYGTYSPVQVPGAPPVTVTPGLPGVPGVTTAGARNVPTGTELAFRYLLLKPEGYTPFRFDTMGHYNLLTADFVHRTRSFQAALGTGRDFRGGDFAWQDGRVRLRFTPSDNFMFSTASAYDFNQGYWRDVVNDMRYRFGAGFLNLGVRYTPLTRRVGTVRWNLFTPLGRRYSIQTLGGWNGFAQRYDYRALRLNWEHHDFRLSVAFVEQVGYRSEKGIRLTLQLRAFPMTDALMTGQFGQSLDTTEVGEIF